MIMIMIMMIESTTHVLSMCSKIAQTLYVARDDHMLRPIYHYLLHKHGYQESDHSKPWNKEKQPQSVLQNNRSKVQWNLPFHLKRAPSTNRIDMSVCEGQGQE